MALPQDLALSVLLPLYDPRGDPLERVRAWTHGQRGARDRFELVFGSDGSDPALEAEVEPLLAPQDRIVRTDSHTSAGLWQRALEGARAPFALITELHAVPEPGCVEALVDFVMRHPETEAANLRTGHRGGGRLAKLERIRFQEHMALWSQPGHWCKVRLRGTLMRTEILRKIGGLLPESRSFAEQDLSARFHDAGFGFAHVPNAEVKHQDTNDLHRLRSDVWDFTTGEMECRARRDADFCERYFGVSEAWNGSALQHPAVAPEARRAAARTLGSALTRPGALRWAPPLAAELVRHGAGPKARVLAARLAGRAHELRWRFWARGDAAVARAYQAASMAGAQAVRLEWLQRNRERPLGPPDPSSSLELASCFPDRIIGFHGVEALEGALFRWSAPIALVRMTAPAGAARVTVSLCPLRPRLCDLPLGIFWNGRRISDAEVTDERIVFEVSGDGRPEEGRLVLVCPKLPHTGSRIEPRRLGLAVRSIAVEDRN